MSPLEFAEFETVLQRVQSWPAPLQLSLATRVLQSLEASSSRPTQSIKNLLGLLTAGGLQPSDEECEAIIAAERQRKYG